jgi:high-affinity Fe2+/Pb2+ permease
MKDTLKVIIDFCRYTIKNFKQGNLIAHVYAYIFGSVFSLFLTWLVYQFDVLCENQTSDKFYLCHFIMWNVIAYIALASSITENKEND